SRTSSSRPPPTGTSTARRTAVRRTSWTSRWTRAGTSGWRAARKACSSCAPILPESSPGRSRSSASPTGCILMDG
ncbi:MAG: hypothetical protein E6J65_25570, partial [Deltaproteobacteria bacterium]